MNFKTAMKTVLKDKYVTFSGRASRSEYWWFVAGVSLLSAATAILDIIVFGLPVDTSCMSWEEAIAVQQPIGWFNLALIVAIILPSIAVTSRRLQDRGRSGWNQLWQLTIIGIIPVYYWLLMPAKEKSNKWGTNPAIAELKEATKNLPK